MKIISDETWAELVEINQRAGWASEGVFAPAMGPDFVRGQGLLYVGKSAGPLGSKVGSTYDQAGSSAASIDWMISKRNKSAFWQFVDNVDFQRLTISWTNLCKMDVRGGQRPPKFTRVVSGFLHFHTRASGRNGVFQA